MSLSFRYEARGPAGKVERGQVQASDRADALERLRRRNLTAYELKQANETLSAAALNDVAARDLARTLSQLLRAGLSFTQALRFAGDELSPGAARVAMRMREAAEDGETASSALDHFAGAQARLLKGVIMAGEASGRLTEALEVAAQSFARSAELRSRMATALIYPSFVVLATLAALGSFLFFVVPTMGGAFEGAEERLPASTRTLMGLSAWLQAHGALAAAALAACILFMATSSAARHFLSALGDRVAVSPLGMGVSLRLEYASFAGLAALSLQAGVPTAPAFEAAADAVRNRRIRTSLARAVADIRLGERPSHAFVRAAAPAQFLRLCHVGEETSRLGETLKQASALLSSEAEQRLERLGAIGGPILTLGLGALVAGSSCRFSSVSWR
jgi:general secretion pathway protein F